MRKKVLAMKWKIFKNCGNKTFDSIELGRRLQETEGCHRSRCTSFTSVAWLKERRIFTQNVFLVYAQTILEVNEIFVQFNSLFEFLSKRLETTGFQTEHFPIKSACH